jgi:hypothetical protein
MAFSVIVSGAGDGADPKAAITAGIADSASNPAAV